MSHTCLGETPWAPSQAQQWTEFPNGVISLRLGVRHEQKAVTQGKVHGSSVGYQSQALQQSDIKLQMKTLLTDFPESSIASKTTLGMLCEWPQKEGFLWLRSTTAARIVLVPKKLMDTSCPFSLLSLLLFACFSPKISLGQAYSLPCQHPCTQRFPPYTEKSCTKYTRTIQTERQLTWWKALILSASAQNPICVLETSLSFGRNF